MAEKHARLVLAVHKEEISLKLEREGGMAEKVVLEDAHTLAERLLPAVDGLLSRHGLKPEDVEGFEVESSLPEGYSARRIAETAARVFTSVLLREAPARQATKPAEEGR
jgi:hypothetical protein